ncbi:MAG: hypothetical protein ACI9RU_001034 [Litorivivens sp.]|jgi:hypothetical protein
MRISLFICCLLLCFGASSQNASLRGTITNKTSNESIPFASIILQNTGFGATSDIDGNYSLDNLESGVYNVQVSFIGFKTTIRYEIELSNSRVTWLNIEMEESTIEIGAAQIVSAETANRDQAPVSVRRIGINEVKRNPGGNRDISRAIRSLPGVTSTTSFRNDLIIRGGAPNENRFYIDGIEIPNINHFATQGSSGGPVGLINVDLIETVDFYSGAFPADRGNALSAVLDFGFKEGRKDRYSANAVIGSSDLGLTLEGPTGKKSSLILSVRRSYLKYLFQAIGLPFLPTYNDFQFKWKAKINDKNSITILGLGAIDDFGLNTSLADSTSENFETNRYLLNLLTASSQWNYTIGAKWDHFNKAGLLSVIVSRNMLNNEAFKYQDNDEALARIFDYSSQEIENKFRVQQKFYFDNGWKASAGLTYERAKYNNRTFQKIFAYDLDSVIDFRVASDLKTDFYGAFVQASKMFFKERLTVSGGVRLDGSSYSSSMSNPLEQFSPRIAAKVQLSPSLSWNSSVGLYHQRPSYTILGYRENGELVNATNGLKYIECAHYITGLRYDVPKLNTTVSLEGFWKRYSDYPFSVGKQISLANLGADFGVIGNESVVSSSEGQAYGLEFLVQQRLFKGFYGILAYTYVRSEFGDGNGDLIASSWDSRHLVSVTAGKKFKRNWELGARFLYSGGLPGTPYDEQNSIAIASWNANRSGLLDYSQLNSQRLVANHQLDLRLDKKWYFKKWSLDVFLDVQNVYNNQSQASPYLDVLRDDNGQPLEDPNNPGFYQANYLEVSSGTRLPSIGIIIEW